VKARAPVLPVLALLGVAGSLLYRVSSRGPYHPGWDVLGSAHGLFVLSTDPPVEALARLVRGARDFRYWNSTNSVPYTLVPGALGRLWRSESWAQWLTFALVLATFWLILRFGEVPLRKAWLLALAWGASSALLSFSVAGYPYATGFLPHALALVIVTSPWLRARPLVSLAAALFATELSWHLYEAGKTLIVVFVVAALLERAVPIATRAGWLLVSAVQVALLLGRRGFNVDYVLRGGSAGPETLAAAAGRTLGALFRPEVDLPVLVPLGLVAALLLRRRRWLVLAGVTSQILTVVLATAVEAQAIRPRRLLTTSFYCLTAVVLVVAETADSGRWRRSFRLVVLTALVSANLWQMADLWIFFRVPPAGRTHPLPYTFSKDDYFVAWGETRLAPEVAREVAGGGSVVMLYNLSSEVASDPPGLLERIYLETGHETFDRSVLSFGQRHCRWDCMPIRPLEDVERDVAVLAAEGRRAVAFYGKGAPATRRHVEEALLVFAAVRRHFDVRPAPDPAPGFGRLELIPRTAAPDPLPLENATSPLPLDLAWLATPRTPAGVVLTSPNGEGPFRYDWSGRVTAEGERTLDLLLGCDGRVRLDVDGQTVSARETTGLTFWRERLLLSPGRHAVGLGYEARSGTGRLLLQIEAPL